MSRQNSRSLAFTSYEWSYDFPINGLIKNWGYNLKMVHLKIRHPGFWEIPNLETILSEGSIQEKIGGSTGFFLHQNPWKQDESDG